MKTFQLATLLAGSSLSSALVGDAPVYVINGMSKVRMPHRRVRGLDDARRPAALLTNNPAVADTPTPPSHLLFRFPLASQTFQMGMFPYLLGGGSVNIQASEQDCMDQCKSIAECKYGTFVTQGSSVDKSTHAFSHLVRYGECWLAAQTHSKPVACGVPCKGFQKALQTDPTPAPTEPNVAQDGQCHCDASTPSNVFMPCMAKCVSHGLHSFKRAACKCDPATDPSVFTTCTKGAFGSHIKVQHLQPRFHTVPFTGGEQHRCKMVADTCKCCDCTDGGGFYEIREIGFGIHTAAAPFIHPISETPVVPTSHDCMDLCHNTQGCQAGTFINGGPDEGQCFLSRNVEQSKACSKPCQSFVRIEEGQAGAKK